MYYIYVWLVFVLCGFERARTPPRCCAQRMQQYNVLCPWEVATLDGLYSDTEITAFKKYVEEADVHNRTFTNSPFKNGKVIHKEWSELMYNRIRALLPDTYRDRHGVEWRFIQSPQYIMYANIQKDQKFGIHTDTGCEYDSIKNLYSKFTVLTYLNHDFLGGNTKFYDDRFNETYTVVPEKNRTLVFDIDLFHSGEQVVEGSKFWIGTELVCAKV